YWCPFGDRLFLGRRDIAGGNVGAGAEEMILHLLREIVARLLVGEVEPVLIDQHLLVFDPLLPRLLRHVLEYALAALARIGREIEPLGLAPELDAFDHARQARTPQG